MKPKRKRRAGGHLREIISDKNFMKIAQNHWADHELDAMDDNFGGGGPLALIAFMFDRALERVVLHGLRQDYLVVQDSLQTIRGQLCFQEQINKHHGRMLPAECLFDDLSFDIPENRLILEA